VYYGRGCRPNQTRSQDNCYETHGHEVLISNQSATIHPWTSVRPRGYTGGVALPRVLVAGSYRSGFTPLRSPNYTSHFVREFTSHCEHAQFSTLPVWRSFTTRHAITVLKVVSKVNLLGYITLRVPYCSSRSTGCVDSRADSEADHKSEVSLSF
jgi:hypothetical protein